MGSGSAPSDQPELHFIEYVEKHSANISSDEAWQLVQEGYMIVEMIARNGLETLCAQPKKARLRQVNAVIWYLMWRASAIEAPFTEGVFDLPDPKGHYWSFFQSMPGSYTRLSSHYPGRTQYAHHGVDLFPEEGDVLPAKKRTLLFNTIRAVDGTQRLYLKPEDHGVSWKKPKEFAHHTWDYIRSRPIVCAIAPRPAPMPFREEHPQQAAVNAFKGLVQQLPFSRQAKQRAAETVRLYGYAGMAHFLTRDPECLSDHPKVKSFIQLLAQEFPDEELKYRTGHEIVVQKEWLLIPEDSTQEECDLEEAI